MNETQTLYQISKLDRELVHAKKELDNLPEAAQIVECRAKRKELKAKQDQVFELTDEVNEKLAKFEAEETSLIEKIKDLQDTLDHSTDYRVTSKVTRDMNGLVKRQGTIAEETDALLERQIKIDHLAAQISDMLGKLDHKEEHLTADFKEQGSKIKARIDEIQQRIDAAAAELSEELSRRYNKVKAEKNGIAIAHFEGSHCSVCHCEFQTGALSKLKSGPEISECPSCHRIFLASIAE